MPNKRKTVSEQCSYGQNALTSGLISVICLSETLPDRTHKPLYHTNDYNTVFDTTHLKDG